MIIDNNHKEYYTDTQEEKVYYITDDNIEDLECFYDELMKRKKDDVNEGGLQATGLIFDGVGVFKINEEDGLEPHEITRINLLKSLEYKLDDSKEKIYARRNIMHTKTRYYEDDKEIITNKATELRIVCAEDYMIIMFQDLNEEFSNFKKRLIYKSGQIARTLKEECKTGEIQFCYSSRYKEREYNDLSEENLLEIKKDLIEEEKTNTNKI